MYGENLNRKSPSVFVMIHPEAESYGEVFTDHAGKCYSIQRLDKDYVIGINGTIAQEEQEQLIEDVVAIYGDLKLS